MRDAAIAALGRVFLAALFLMSGFSKLGAAAATTGYIASVGLPLPGVVYALTLVVEIGGGVLLLIGFQARFCFITISPIRTRRPTFSRTLRSRVACCRSLRWAPDDGASTAAAQQTSARRHDVRNLAKIAGTVAQTSARFSHLLSILFVTTQMAVAPGIFG